ncbi:MAG: hypothetical protein LBT20_00580, partial [Clostridiales bacterium]|nr:hypothetical protein [Clostridiales bacterium]
MKCCLIGSTLKHSYSPPIHALLSRGAYSYDLVELHEREVGAFVRSGKYDAFNVTIPYKKTVIPFLDILDESAEAIGAVNTVVKRGDKLVGYNTDFFGFRYLLTSSNVSAEVKARQDMLSDGACAEKTRRDIFGGIFAEVKARRDISDGISAEGKTVVLLGDGGTAATVKAVLTSLGAKEILIVSRRGAINYENYAEYCGGAQILINTSPVGMFPKSGECLVSLDAFPCLTDVADVVYNPLVTKLGFLAAEKGIPYFGGLKMLVAQAKYAKSLFLNNAECVFNAECRMQNAEYFLNAE